MPRLVQIETWFFGIIHCISHFLHFWAFVFLNNSIFGYYYFTFSAFLNFWILVFSLLSFLLRLFSKSGDRYYRAHSTGLDPLPFILRTGLNKFLPFSIHYSFWRLGIFQINACFLDFWLEGQQMPPYLHQYFSLFKSLSVFYVIQVPFLYSIFT